MATSTHKLNTRFKLGADGKQYNDALEYIIGEKATYTVVNENTGNRFTFKTRIAKNKNFLNVKVLSGPDNTSSYTLMGYISKRTWNFGLSQFTSMTEETQSFKVFQWVYNHLRNNTLPSNITIYHYNKCCRCGRPLTTPESIESGIGPICESMRAMGR